jgi:hypothetical protein
MNVRQSLAFGATLILGMGLGGTCSWQPSFGQPKAEQLTVGRYQVSAYDLGRGAQGTRSALVVIDTATGQCWTKIADITSAGWKNVVSPPFAKK